MAKKQKGQRASPELSVFTQCATAGGGGGGGGKDSASSTVETVWEEFICGQECIIGDNGTGLPAFGRDLNSFDLSYNTSLSLGLSTIELMHKQTTSGQRQDNSGQQPEPTTATNFPIASSSSSATAFPDAWFERPYFSSILTSNSADFSNSYFANADSSITASNSASYGVGSGALDIDENVQGGADGSLDGGNKAPITVSQCSTSPAAESSWVNDSLESTSWRAVNEMQSPLSSSASQALEPSNKRRKKRPSGASFEVFSDSDGSDDDDGSLSDVEEDEGAVRANSQQFSAKFLELRSSGKPCSFWQYNSQARGPKGRRIYGEIALKDCHVLDEFSDPVTQDGSSGGKAQPNKLRHGEGNDPRPDTHKLMEIGSRISRLEEEFRRLSAAAAAKTGSKDEIGRQKNKLASRICRLKKKAQHEANKVKLEGLREEHEELVAVVAKLVTIMEAHILAQETTAAASTSHHVVVASQPSSFCSQLESLIRSHLKFMIAGHTAEYVNMQLQKSAEKPASKNRMSI